jgi:hypothetical protein
MFGNSEVTMLLEEEIRRNVRELKFHEVISEEYQKRMDRLVALYRMKEEEKSKFGSKDTLAVVFGNLLGIFMIVKHEHVNVLTSRAMQLIRMPTPKP